MNTTTFIAALQANRYGLYDRLVITVGTRGNGSLRCETGDSHAAHAVELIANRAGLRVLATMTDDGLHVITVRGFTRG